MLLPNLGWVVTAYLSKQEDGAESHAMKGYARLVMF